MNPQNCLDDERTLEAIDGLVDSGITLYVVGIAASDWTAVLNQMASHGGTDAAIMVDDPTSIEDAFEAITGTVASCEWEIGEPDPDADPNFVNFYFDDEQVPMDAEGECDEGWAWANEEETRVIFCGSFCDRLLSGSVGNVRATYGCPTLI